MNTVLHIWDTLVKSNTFNFIVMLLILGWIVKKFAIKDSLEGLKNSVINSIEKAKEEKENALTELQKAEKSVENVAENILSKTEEKIKQIEDNIQRTVDAEEKTISAKLASKTAKASAELAKNHIKSMLKAHPELHKKYIDQSIEELG